MRNLLNIKIFNWIHLPLSALLISGTGFSQNVGFSSTTYSVTEGTDNGYTWVNIPIANESEIDDGTYTVKINGYRTSSSNSFTANVNSTGSHAADGGYVTDIYRLCEGQNGSGTCVYATQSLTISNIDIDAAGNTYISVGIYNDSRYEGSTAETFRLSVLDAQSDDGATIGGGSTSQTTTVSITDDDNTRPTFGFETISGDLE